MTTVLMHDKTTRELSSFAEGEFGVACAKRQVLAVIEPRIPRADTGAFVAAKPKPLTESQRNCLEGQ